jgi:methionine sulfoxide reductase heme-binding subunit
VALFLFMTLSPFDPLDYDMVDMSGSGALPKQADTSVMERMDHGSGDQAEPTVENADQAAGDQAVGQAGGQHSGGQTGSMHESADQAGGDNGGDQAEPTAENANQTTGDHGSGQTGSVDEGGNQSAEHGGGQTQPAEEMDDQGQGEDRAAFTIGGLRVIQDRITLARFTTASGYVATGLLALTLLIGPVNLLRRKRNPVSSYFRRDVGTWTFIFSVVHVVFGLELHSGGQLANMYRYFVVDGEVLTNSFGLGNWTGLAALLIVAGLLAISSDAALRKLKAKNWKRLQRLNYALFALVFAHAFFYGALLRTDSPFTLLLLLSVVAVFVGQAVGVWLWRQRYARKAAAIA